MLFLRRRLRPLAPRASKLRRLLYDLRLYLDLGAIGFDHHQARILEELLRIDARLLDARRLPVPRFGARFFGAALLGAWRLDRCRRCFVARLLARLPASLLLACGFRLLLELVDAALLLGERSGRRRVLLARAIAAIALAAVAAATIASAAAVFFAVALGPGTLTLNVGRELVELRRLASWRRWRRLLRPWRLPLLRLALRLRPALISPVRARSAITVGTPLVALALALALLRRLAIAPALETSLLLPIAAITALAAITTVAAVAAPVAPLLVMALVVAALLIARLVAPLITLRLRLRYRPGLRRRAGRGRLE